MSPVENARPHAWAKRIKKDDVDLGKGKRTLLLLTGR
jgi:hypothetical protein